jgi:uncharacterized 2Fe-2S/4Fe-4S cluster protein (DUF4445 family)
MQPQTAAAFDIGTTTIQAQLVDLHTGQTLGTFSGLNDQRLTLTKILFY